MERRLHLLESFKARGDDGNIYAVHGYEHLARLEGAPDLDEAWQPTGTSEFRLASGEAVTVDRSGTMTVVGRALKLRRDPTAVA